MPTLTPRHLFPFDLARLTSLIDFTFRVHDKFPNEPRMRFRRWDARTPYGIHPVWCAMMFLTETTLPEDVRDDGALALLLHDVLEDTQAPLPSRLPPRVEALVEEKTFASFEEEHELIWGRSELCRLLTTYDKVSNLLDANWRTNKRDLYVAYTLRLADEAEKRWGTLNIVRIARAIAV